MPQSHFTLRNLTSSLVLGLWMMGASSPLRGDEPTRRAQEELRRRNLYFGEIDGRATSEFKGAVRRYQQRKGFDENGELDKATAASLHIPIAEAARERLADPWPDVIILKSDTARILPETERPVLAAASLDDPFIASSPTAPGESPPPDRDLPVQEVQKFVEAYLSDAATNDVPTQIKYYEFPVEYFDHGQIKREGVMRDTRNYVKRWPTRKYTLEGPAALSGSDDNREMEVQFTIAFAVSNAKGGRVQGRTRNFWTIVRESNGRLKISSIREERLPN